MADLRCRGCKILFNNQKVKNQHISASPDCLAVYEALSTQQASVQPPPLEPAPPTRIEHIAPLPYAPLHWPDINYDQPSPPAADAAEESAPKRRRVTVEEVEEESSEEKSWIHERFPGEVAASLGTGVTVFSDALEEQNSMQEQPYAPFRDRKEWGLAKWLMRRTNQTGADEYLKLEITRTVTKPSFKNKVAMFRKVDALPVGPRWYCDIVNVTGDCVGPKGELLTEELDLWRRDAVDCIRDLIGNPAFKDVIVYEPTRVKRDGQRYYSEMGTGDWWWNVQKRLPKGAAVAAVILASDKTNLSVFRGDKTAWPVYLTIANIDKDPISLDILARKTDGSDVPEFDEHGLRPIPQPFWAELPHTDIFATISPDILHQLHKGIFKDHLVAWVSKLIGKAELDRRFASLSRCHGVRHFKTGISGLTQWTGAEAKEIEKVLLGILVGRVEPDVVAAVKALLDFIYLAQYHVHSDTTLQLMQNALRNFHRHKDCFVKLGVREHFNIPKLHALLHYLEAIASLGCLDGLNTETSERLHIDYAKNAYRASSRNEYVAQMTTWLQRQEAVVRKDSYLSWVLGDGDDADSETDTSDEDSTTSEDSEEDMGEEENQASEDEVQRTAAISAEQAAFKTLKSLLNSNVRRAYHLPLSPSARRVSLADLENRYGAQGFLADLKIFLDLHFPTAAVRPNEFDTYDVFHYINLLKPAVRHFDNSKRICKIRAVPAKPRQGTQRAVPAYFDCGLFIVDEDKYRLEGGLNGLCAARVRAMFHLPAHLGHFSHPLMYVEWFRPFRGPEPRSSLYTTGHSTLNKARRHSIVSAKMLLCSCHLIPKYGPDDVDPDWTPDTVLDECVDFYLNSYVDFHMFHELVLSHRV
uniref:Uncharacterized protein n=1 Tax=Ganoderma boninense TaxID=34458 RepID=A0A5K1K1J9_9APHY|nr:Uncharacterized protein [Ganoderma boninense]